MNYRDSFGHWEKYLNNEGDFPDNNNYLQILNEGKLVAIQTALSYSNHEEFEDIATNAVLIVNKLKDKPEPLPESLKGYYLRIVKICTKQFLNKQKTINIGFLPLDQDTEIALHNSLNALFRGMYFKNSSLGTIIGAQKNKEFRICKLCKQKPPIDGKIDEKKWVEKEGYLVPTPTHTNNLKNRGEAIATYMLYRNRVPSAYITGEDCAMQAYLQVETINVVSDSLWAYYRQVVVRVTLKYIRKYRTEKNKLGNVIVDQPDLPIVFKDSVLELAYQKLKPKQRLILYLRCFDGMKSKEIVAEFPELFSAPSQVDKCFDTAKKRLRTILKKEFGITNRYALVA